MMFWLGPLGMSDVRPNRVSRSEKKITATTAAIAKAGHGAQREPMAHAIVSTW